MRENLHFYIGGQWVDPALATGCTVVLKPSEIAPFSGQIFAEIIDAADPKAGSRYVSRKYR